MEVEPVCCSGHVPCSVVLEVGFRLFFLYPTYWCLIMRVSPGPVVRKVNAGFGSSGARAAQGSDGRATNDPEHQACLE